MLLLNFVGRLHIFVHICIYFNFFPIFHLLFLQVFALTRTTCCVCKRRSLFYLFKFQFYHPSTAPHMRTHFHIYVRTIPFDDCVSSSYWSAVASQLLPASISTDAFSYFTIPSSCFPAIFYFSATALWRVGAVCFWSVENANASCVWTYEYVDIYVCLRRAYAPIFKDPFTITKRIYTCDKYLVYNNNTKS